MFDERSFYKLLNARVEAQYQKEKEQLKWIAEEMKIHKGPKEARLKYAKSAAVFLLDVTGLEERWDPSYYLEASGEQLKKDQQRLFQDLYEENYQKNVLNPAFAVKVLGPENGALLSAVAWKLRENIAYAYRHMRFAMHWNQEFFLELFQLLNQDRKIKAQEILELTAAWQTRHAKEREQIRLHMQFDYQDATRRSLIEELDWSDPLNLYALGEYVSAEALERQAYINQLPEEKIQEMANTLVQEFRRGFFRVGKDILSKKVVMIEYPLGLEKLTQKLIALVREEIHYIPHILRIETEPVSLQAEADHAGDKAALLTDLYYETAIEACRSELEENAPVLDMIGGRICVSSDAHSASGIVCAFEQSEALARACGFTELWELTQDGFRPAAF